MLRRALVAVSLALGLTQACGMPMTTSPREGGACQQENQGACESSTRMLVCRERVWQVLSDCKGASGCRLEGDTVNCDTRGNGVGDRCSAPGAFRCDPDGGLQILRCEPPGVLRVEFSCPNTVQQTQCVLIDAGTFSCR